MPGGQVSPDAPGPYHSLPPNLPEPCQVMSHLGHCEACPELWAWPGFSSGPGSSPGLTMSHHYGHRLQKKHLQQEKECLMSKLVEAEMDGAAAAKQVLALKDTIGKLKTVGRALGGGVGSCLLGVGSLRSHQADFMTSTGMGGGGCAHRRAPFLPLTLWPDPRG